MRRRFASLAFTLTLASPLAYAQTPAPNATPTAPPTPAAIAEARDRFQRAVDLSDEGNYAAAMAEFQRAYQLTRNPLVLYNISATHEAAGHYVEALDAMQQYAATAPSEVVATRRTEVDAALTRLRGRIGRIVVRTDAPGLEVRIDGLVRATQESHAGAPVSAGRHRVVLIAPNFQTGEREVDVAGGATVEVTDALVPAQSSIAVDSNVPGADVLIDNRVMAVTPTASPIGVAEGAHHVTVRRAGYSTYETDVNSIGTGARVRAQLTWSDAIPAASAAHMVLRANETGLVATLDGRRVSVDGTDPLPPGAHRLRVERSDYLPEERDVDLPAGRSTTLDVFLLPTPAYQDSYLAHARGVRTAGLAVLLTGVAVAGAGAVVFVLNNGAVSDDITARDALVPQLAAMAGATTFRGLQSSYNDLQNRIDALTIDNIIALSVAGAGVITAAVGIGIMATAPSSRHFERQSAIRVVPGLRSLGLAVSF